jgi:hypothetical protein
MAETLQETFQRLTTFVNENYTDIETGPGSVISELLIKLEAVLQNKTYNKIEELSQGSAISHVLEAAEDSYSPIMDGIASNFNASRSAGTKVRGRIKVTLSSPNEFFFSEGFTFVQTALGLKYVLPGDARVSKNPGGLLNEVQLYEDQGFYYFILDVEAEQPGESYQLSSGTVFDVTEPFTITNFVRAEAYGNFSTGKSVETDKQLVQKIKYALGHSRLESYTGIMNRFSEAFPGLQSISVCGANDAEMIRSKENLLGISTFGKADIYVRSSLGPETREIVKSAQKISDGVWQMAIGQTDIPGFYAIKSILPKVQNISLGGTLLIKSIEYGHAPYPGVRNNEINNRRDARFTKYQTAAVTFSYADKENIAIGGLADFFVTASYQPNIREMQDMLLLDHERLACADYLVKAVVPCMVSLKINLAKKRITDTYESLNLQQLKKDIFAYVNSIPFGESLYASSIIDLCHNYDIRRVSLPMTMTGNIFCPDGSTLYIEDSNVLEIPDELSKGVTKKTTLYFIDYYRISDDAVNPVDNIGLSIA